MRHTLTGPGIYWKQGVTAQVMGDNGIWTRNQLAARLEPLGVTRPAIYRGFDEQWRGRVSSELLLAMMNRLSVPVCPECGLPQLIQLVATKGGNNEA